MLYKSPCQKKKNPLSRGGACRRLLAAPHEDSHAGPCSPCGRDSWEVAHSSELEVVGSLLPWKEEAGRPPVALSRGVSRWRPNARGQCSLMPRKLQIPQHRCPAGLWQRLEVFPEDRTHRRNPQTCLSKDRGQGTLLQRAGTKERLVRDSAPGPKLCENV